MRCKRFHLVHYFLEERGGESLKSHGIIPVQESNSKLSLFLGEEIISLHLNNPPSPPPPVSLSHSFVPRKKNTRAKKLYEYFLSFCFSEIFPRLLEYFWFHRCVRRSDGCSGDSLWQICQGNAAGNLGGADLPHLLFLGAWLTFLLSKVIDKWVLPINPYSIQQTCNENFQIY